MASLTNVIDKMGFETKSPEMQNFLNKFTQQNFGRSVSDSLRNEVCVTCGKPIAGFRNALSEKEYRISGMCQECQDGVFGKE